MKTPLAPCALPDTVTPATVGARTSAPSPSTTTSPSAIAWSERLNRALLFPRSRMVPPLVESELAPMLSPFGSSSSVTTV